MDKTRLTISTYNKIARRYAELNFDDTSNLRYVDKFLSYLPKNIKILDAGCGVGNLTKYILAKGYECEGIDLSEEMIKIAKEKVPEGKFTLMDMQSLSYADAMFDGIISVFSLIHIPSTEVPDVLKEFNRVLKSNGFLLLIVQKGEADHIVEEPLNKNEKIFINFFTQERLTTLLNAAGFKTIKQEEMRTPNINAGEFTKKSDTVIYTIAKKV